MPLYRLAALTLLPLTLAACGLGDTAATASLQAKQAEQAQQQMQQLKQQVDQANAQNQQRLDQALKDAE